MSAFKTDRILIVLKALRKIMLERKEITFKLLSQSVEFNEYELFLFVCSLYHNKLIEVDYNEFYKEPLNRRDFRIWIAPGGFDLLLEHGII